MNPTALFPLKSLYNQAEAFQQQGQGDIIVSVSEDTLVPAFDEKRRTRPIAHDDIPQYLRDLHQQYLADIPNGVVHPAPKTASNEPR